VEDPALAGTQEQNVMVEQVNAALYQRDLLKAAVRTLDWVLLQSDKPT